jgi:hypothetical protein
MSFNGNRDPFPKSFPLILIGIVVVGFIAYQLMS